MMCTCVVDRDARLPPNAKWSPYDIPLDLTWRAGAFIRRPPTSWRHFTRELGGGTSARTSILTIKEPDRFLASKRKRTDRNEKANIVCVNPAHESQEMLENKGFLVQSIIGAMAKICR
jgi:hypothetical protein